MTHLSKFPVSWLKIDQSFIRELGDSPDATAIVKAVIGLSRSLGIQVVAEGVETLDQWRELKRRGCDLAQGYLIAKPMSADRVPHFMRTWQGVNTRSKGKQAAC
ncbi:EAL domain-containing protein [Devosia sediminis]|uniref:EAL domain-containing protein n=1 Tax=Devosia sediminis TaxID=2798801 RepID=UPI001F1FE4C1|nr:EAL domain-containing protein [Devosia sediminis]